MRRSDCKWFGGASVCVSGLVFVLDYVVMREGGNVT